jgi:hypothetical protein
MVPLGHEAIPPFLAEQYLESITRSISGEAARRSDDLLVFNSSLSRQCWIDAQQTLFSN